MLNGSYQNKTVKKNLPGHSCFIWNRKITVSSLWSYWEVEQVKLITRRYTLENILCFFEFTMYFLKAWPIFRDTSDFSIICHITLRQLSRSYRPFGIFSMKYCIIFCVLFSFSINFFLSFYLIKKNGWNFYFVALFIKLVP